MNRENSAPGRREFLVSCLSACFLGTLSFPSFTHARGTIRSGEMLPNITLSDLSGTPVEIPSELKGKVALVHFWASWCSYCAREVAVLDALYRKYSAKGLITLSVNVGESKGTVASFIERQRISYPVLVDPASAAARRYGVSGIPTTIVLNHEGIVKFRIIGETTYDGLEKIANGLLKEVR